MNEIDQSFIQDLDSPYSRKSAPGREVRISELALKLGLLSLYSPSHFATVSNSSLPSFRGFPQTLLLTSILHLRGRDRHISASSNLCSALLWEK